MNYQNHPTPGTTRCRVCLTQLAFSRRSVYGWCISPSCRIRGKLQGLRPLPVAPHDEVRHQAHSAGLLTDQGGMSRFPQ